MANNQLFPASSYPGAGDILTTPGSPQTTVTGWQGVPVSSATPLPGQIPVMNSDGTWHMEDPVVSGTDAIGTAPTKNPVQVAGIDDGNLVRELRTDTYGGIRSPNIEEKLDTVIALLRALIAATIADKPLDDSDFTENNFTDEQAGV